MNKRTFPTPLRAFATVVFIAAAFAGKGSATTTFVNGGFETGDLTGWQTYEQDGGLGGFYVTGDQTTPVEGFPTPGPDSGDYYAVSDSPGYSAEALIQSFTVAPGASATLSFDMFVNTYAPMAESGGLDYTSGGTYAPNQYARVDLLSGNADPFDTTGGVIANFYFGADPMTDGSYSNPYTAYNIDLTQFIAAGGTFQVRWADVANQHPINVGLDNVSLDVQAVPEPSELPTLLLVLAGMWRGAAWAQSHRARC